MSIVDKDNLTLFPDAALAALTRLEQILAERGLDARIDGALRLVPGKRAIFHGELAGQPAVFRLPLNDTQRKNFAQEWAELTRARGHMATGAFRVADPLFFDPDTGLFTLSHIEGTPLLTHLWSLDPDARAPHIAGAADWLHAYMAPTIETRGINRRPWRNWAAVAVEKQPHPALADLEKRILQKMNKLSHRLGDPDWRVAIPHGDFHLNNLILGPDGALTGIDTGGSNFAPIYKDIARALTHMARRGMLPSGSRKFGVDAAAYDTFATAFALTEAEANAFLPYLITFETLIKVEHPRIGEDRVAHALAMEEALFQDLRQIT